MPYQVGDKVVLAGLDKNRNHHKLPRFLGQVLDVVEVLDREPWDGNGDQNLRIEQIDRGLYNSGRFQLAAPQWAINPFAPIAQHPVGPRPFHVGQNVQSRNLVWIVHALIQGNRLELEVVAQKHRFRGRAIGERGVFVEREFTAIVEGDDGWQALNGLVEAVNAAGQGLGAWGNVPMAPPMPNAIIEDNIAHVVKHEFQPGDVVVLTQDKERQNKHDVAGWVGQMDKWAEEGREFVLRHREDDRWRVEGEHVFNFVYDEEWFDMAKAVLKVGDKVWYKDHCDEDNRAMFIEEGRRPIYWVGAIKDNGKLHIHGDQDGAIGNAMAHYDDDQWVKAKPAKGKKAKPEPVLDPKVQAEKLEKLIGECVAKFAANAGGCANFYLIQEKKNGELIKIGGTGMPCHYELRGGYGDEGKGVPVAVIDSIHRRREHLPKFKQQGFIDYVTYLLNRSPWADCYLAKDFEDAEKNGIRMNLDKTANQLVGACIAMRQSSEYDSVLPVHAFLKAKRFSGDVCFLVGQYYSMDQNGNITPITLNSGHVIITTSMTADAVFKFFATKEFMNEDGKKPYRENKAYSNIFGSITGREEYARAKAGEVTIEQWMRKNCVAKQVGEGLAKKQVVTEASLLKLARAVKAELIKHKAKEEVAA